MKYRIYFRLPLLLVYQTFLEGNVIPRARANILVGNIFLLGQKSWPDFFGVWRRGKHYWWGEAFPGAQLSCAGDPPISPWLFNIIFVNFCFLVCIFVCLFVWLFVVHYVC